MKTLFAHWKAAFLTGLAVILPAAVSIALVIWLFGLVAHFTDTLLVFVPQAWTHPRNGEETSPLHWSVLALASAILLVSLVGGLARYYSGKKLIQLVDTIFMRVPLLNKIYSVLKRINEAFTSNQAAAFKQVVLVEFPRPGLYSLGFLTGTQDSEVRARSRKSLVSVFVPTPPLTSGSIVLVPEADVIKLEMSVADGIKFIMSLGSVSPACAAQATAWREVREQESRTPARTIPSPPDGAPRKQGVDASGVSESRVLRTGNPWKARPPMRKRKVTNGWHVSGGSRGSDSRSGEPVPASTSAVAPMPGKAPHEAIG